MSWVLGTIHFETYGVMVSRSTGVLDLPKLKHEGFEWLDEPGKDYWQTSTKYNDRDILLNCWIYEDADEFNSGYVNFQAKVAAFLDALKVQGKCTLVTPYITISNCSVSAGVNIVRETNYVQAQQVGTFTLKITVHGDTDYTLLDIKRYEPGLGTWTKATVKTKNLQVVKSLQGDFYATCTFESNEKLNLQYYDFIAVNSNGANNDIFHLPADAYFTKTSSNKFAYNLRFEHQSKWLDESQFADDLGQTDFYFYANMDEIIDLIITNHNRSWWSNFQKGTVVSTIRKNHKFTAESCLSVLKRLCLEYVLEFEFEYITAGQYKINVKETVANDKIITFQYGKGNSLYEISRGTPDLSKLCTVLFAYGAAKNIPAGYRSGMTRLALTGNPLRQNDDLLTEYGPHEQTVFFDDIYPERSSVVTGYLQVLPENLTSAEKEVYPEGIFAVGDTALLDLTYGFDLNLYLRDRQTAKIRMKTGALAGYEFDILRYDHTYQVMQIIRFQEETGSIVPNATLQIAPGDEYTLVEIDQPPVYVNDGEDRLLAAANAYLLKWSTPIYPYSVKVDPAFIIANPTGFEVGDRITVADTDYVINEPFRISNLTYNVHTKIFDLTLADYRQMSKRQQTEFRLQVIERSIFSAKKDTVEVIKNDQQTTGEVRRTLLDPDNKLRVDKIVENNAIDPRMLGFDTGIPLWNVQDAIVDGNFTGNSNLVHIGTGIIKINNDPVKTLDRYGIEKKRINSETYDPTREWDIIETTLTLTDPNAYFIYAKLNMTPESRECEIFASQEFLQAKSQYHLGYVIHQIGTVSKDEPAL